MKRDLPKHLYLQGSTYRAKLPGGRRVGLGTDRAVALQNFNVLMSVAESVDITNPAEVLIMWKRHRKGAKQRCIEFSITPEDIALTLTQQGHRCAVTYLPFRSDKPLGMRMKPWAASIDRRLSSEGYVPGNIRVVCGFVNVAMNGFGDQFFAQVLEPLVQARVNAELMRLESVRIPKNPKKIPMLPIL